MTATLNEYTDRILPMVRRAENSDDDAVSPMGAVGRYQIMPSTARALGYDPARLKEPAYNETVARAAIADLVRQHGQDDKAVLAGYNASPAAVRKWKKAGRNDLVLPEETQKYFGRAGLVDTGETPYVPVEGPAGKQKYQALLDGGYSVAEADQWASETADALRQGGYKESEVADYFGDVKFDTSSQEALAKTMVAGIPPGEHKNVAHNWSEALNSGLQSGVFGLAVRGREADLSLPEDATLAEKIAFSGGQMLSDLPAFLAGAAGGSMVAPGFGTWAGASALPAAIRGALIDSYRNPNGHKDWGGWASAYGHVAFDTLKEGLIGGIGGRTGELAGAAVKEIGGKAIAQSTAFAAAQIPASIGASSVMEGRVPNLDDFTAAAAMTVGFGLAGHAVGAMGRFVPSKPTKIMQNTMETIYGDLGIHPQELAKLIQDDVAAFNEVVGTRPDGSKEMPTIKAKAPDEPPPEEMVIKKGEGEDATEELVKPPEKPKDPLDEKLDDEDSDALMAKMTGEEFHEMPPEEDRLTEVQKAIGGKVLTEVSHGKFEWDGPDGNIIGTYLRKFGELAGFAFKLVKGERRIAEKGGAGFLRDSKGRNIVEIPVTDEELTRRWYGLGRYEILHHEVGHAIDLMNTSAQAERMAKGLGKGGTGWLSYAIEHNKALRDEAIELSKGFRPKIWSKDSQYTMQMKELAADAIARWLSDPTVREQFPEMKKFLGDKLDKYLEAAQKALPVKSEGGGWQGPNGEDAAAAGGGGGGKGPGGIVPHGTIFEGEEGPEPLRIGHRMSYEEATGHLDGFIGEKPSRWPHWLNPRVWLRQFVTELANSRVLDKELGNDPHKNGVEDMMRQTYASAARAATYVRYGTTRLGRDAASGDIVYHDTKGPSMMAAFAKARENGGTQEGFIRYLVSARAMMLDKRGIEPGVNIEAARVIIEDTHPIYHEAAKLWQENNESVVDYVRDAGVYSQKTSEGLKTLNPFHIVFNRVRDPSYRGTGTGSGFGPQFPTKRIKGSLRQIIPPIPAQIDNMIWQISMADRNLAVGKVLDGIIKREGNLPSDGKSVILKERWDVAKMRDEFKALPDPSKIDEAGNPIGDKDFDAIMPAIAYRKFHGSRGENDFLYFNRGVPEIYTARDPETALLLRATQPVGEANLVGKIFESFANIGRLGIVSAPDFPIRTTIRGQFEAALRSKYSNVPFHAWFTGIMHVIKQDELFQQFMRDGGFGAAAVDIEERYIQRDLNKIFQETGGWDRVWNAFPRALDGLKAFRQTMENAGRLGEWKLAKEAGATGGKAAMESRKTFGDARERAGLSWMNTWAKNTIFMQPSVMDLAYFSQALRTRAPQVLATGFLTVSLPTIAAFINNKWYDADKEHNAEYRKLHPEYIPYSEMPRWQKDMMLIGTPMNGVRPRFPIVPYTGGFVFHTLLNRFLEYAWDKDPRAFNDWGQTFLAQFLPPVIPALSLPILEAATNWRQGTGTPLISEGMERLSPDQRYTANTSETAKNLAKVMGNVGIHFGGLDTPIDVDNYIREYTGPLVSSAIRAIDGTMAHDNRPWQLADIPIIGMFFTRHPDMTAQPISDFYRQLDNFEKKHADLSRAIRTQDFSSVPELMNDKRSLANISKIIDMAKAMNQATILLRAMDTSKMTNAEKQKYMDKGYSEINEIAKVGLQILDSLPDAFK